MNILRRFAPDIAIVSGAISFAISLIIVRYSMGPAMCRDGTSPFGAGNGCAQHGGVNQTRTIIMLFLAVGSIAVGRYVYRVIQRKVGSAP